MTKIPTSIVAALALATGAAHATATPGQARALFGFRVAMACLAQDTAAYSQSPLAREIAASPGFKDWSGFESHPLTRCMRERRFVDKALCDDLMATLGVAPDTEGEAKAINAALDRHAAALEVADQVLALEDATRRSPDTFMCPAVLPAAPSAPASAPVDPQPKTPR